MRRLIYVCLTFTILLFGAPRGFPQACGNIYAKFFVRDVNEKFVDGATFQLLRRETGESIMYKDGEITARPEIGAYTFAHGLCGSHRGTRLIIERPGFETFEATVDLPLNMPRAEHVFTIKLARAGSSDTSSLEQWATLVGKVQDASGKSLSNVAVTLTSHGGESLKEVTSEFGIFSFSIKDGAYTLEVDLPGEKVRHDNLLLQPGPNWQDVVVGASKNKR